MGAVGDGADLVVHIVHLGLGKHEGAGGGVDLRRHTLHVVAVEDAQPGEAAEPHRLGELPAQGLGGAVKARLFFHETAKYFSHG